MNGIHYEQGSFRAREGDGFSLQELKRNFRKFLSLPGFPGPVNIFLVFLEDKISESKSEESKQN